MSRRDQNEDRQLPPMQEVGISPRTIFIDRQSGKNFNRKHYQLLK
ncbi:hypothetical protein [Priestia megaterium]|nr:hypothetical protein [Priestia megaterium]MDN3233114.1 hypothetical protein [Priestia megaterium]